MSPRTPEIDGLEILGYLLKVEVWLWEKEPESVEEEPDMIFVLWYR